jgi:hypothetical protein
MSQESNVPRLVAGPYKPLRCKIGDVLSDLLRGDVAVSAFSKAPIPCPMGRARKKAKLAPILTSELERAIRTESSKAVKYWWGVGTWLAWVWRHQLKVTIVPSGTEPTDGVRDTWNLYRIVAP